MVHRTFGKKHRAGGRGATLGRLAGVVPAEFIEAARLASRRLTEMGVSHVLVGGMAVGAHGYPRPTKDVDFLVGEEAFEHHGLVVTMRPGLPIAIGKVAIDLVSLDARERKVLKPFLRRPAKGAGVSIIPIEALVYMKLQAGRQRDRSDVVELVKAGAVDGKRMQSFLVKHAPRLLFSWGELERMAGSEAD